MKMTHEDARFLLDIVGRVERCALNGWMMRLTEREVSTLHYVLLLDEPSRMIEEAKKLVYSTQREGG